MQEIAENLTNPSWWFTIIAAIMLGLIINKLIKYFFKLLDVVIRGRGAKEAKRIKNLRRKSYEIQYLIIEDRGYFIVFVITCLIYLVLITTSQIISIIHVSLFFGVVFTLPIYVFEIVWLKKSAFLRKLLDSANKI